MKTPFNWGIIGPGRIAEKFSEAVHHIDNAEVYAIASRSAQNPKKIQDTFSSEKFYLSYEELVSDPKVDAVYIATPHRFHYENVKLCLEAGKAVLCEKSFTVNAAQAEELFKLSQSKKVFLMEALWTRFLPIYKKVREWLDEDKIGDVRLLTSTLGFVADRNLDDRLLNIELAGGTILDLAVYNSAISQWVMRAEPQTIQAAGIIGETGVDEVSSAIYTYANGAISQYTSTFQTAPRNQLVIAGTKGRIFLHTIFVSTDAATLEIGPKKKTVKRPFRVNGFEYQIEASMQAIRLGALDCPQMTQADTLANMRALDTARQKIGIRYPFE